MIQLHCLAQNYDWGKPGATSEVARLLERGRASSGAPGPAIDPAAPYAEYWFGTHPRGPSIVVPETSGAPRDVTLHDYLMSHPDAMGIPAYAPTSALPFLLKILSIARALSIQVHPDSKLAAALHSHPDAAIRVHYADPNHKPEMAVALTPFKALCGFRPQPQMVHYCESIPELAALVDAAALAALKSASSASDLNAALHALFKSVVTAPVEVVKRNVDALIARLRATPALSRVDALALSLGESYPSDIGVMCAYLLNDLDLSPGQALYLGAGVPHAYVSGDAVEVMAASDNVIRVGLTPKFKDVHTLLQALVYEAGVPQLVTPLAIDDATGLYMPPDAAHVSEFMLLHTQLQVARGAYEFKLPPPAAGLTPRTATGAAVMLVQRGTGVATAVSSSGVTSSHALGEGSIWLIPAGCGVTLTATGSEPLCCFTSVNNVYATPSGAATA